METIFFDVNGTLLNTSVLTPSFARVFGSRYTVEQWFEQVIGYSMAVTMAGRFEEFERIAKSVLEMAADARGISLKPDQEMKIIDGMKRLPAFPDVKPALKRFADRGCRLVAFSNSSSTALEAQLQHAGLAAFFERQLSVDLIRRFKPSSDTYEAAARAVGVGAEDVLMVAAHPWDLMGARSAGCRTAFIRRPLKALLPAFREPDYIAGDLRDLADQLIGKTTPVMKTAAISLAAAAGGILLSRALRSSSASTVS